jgi:hypothetical protein
MAAIFRATVTLLGVCVVFAAAGCGNSPKPKAPEQAPATAAAEEKDEAPVEKPPAKAEKKPEAKPAHPPVARRRSDDPTKWELADLKTGLSAQDARFIPAVVAFGMQHPKQADELRALLERAGQLKDDPAITLPLSPLALPAAVTTASKPVTPSPATPPADKNSGSQGRRRMGGRMSGYGGQKSGD